MSDDRKVFIVGANFRNKGAAAMVQTAVDELDEAVVTISSIFNDDLGYNDQYDVIKHVRLLELILKEILYLITGGILHPHLLLIRWERKRKELTTYFRHLRQADVVVDLSGYALTDKFGTFRIWSWIEVLLCTKVLRKPFIMLPQSVGPLSKRRNRWLVRVFLPLADFRSVRGSVSEKWLRKSGVSNVEKYPDTAFLFEPASEKRGHEILTQLELADTRFVTIVPNARLYERWDIYEEELCEIVKTIQKYSTYSILVLPHEYTEGGDIDDRFVINRLRDHSVFDQAVMVDDELNARELKRIIGESQLLIGSRLHSTVAGVSMNTPTIAIGWSKKYYEILEWVDSKETVWLPETYNREHLIKQIETILETDRYEYPQLETIMQQSEESYDSIRVWLNND